MTKYLYVFAYQTPEQLQAAETDGFKEESSAAVYIEAGSVEEALTWGRQVSENFVFKAFGGERDHWNSRDFAHWIENQPESEYPREILARVPVVSSGVYPDIKQLRG